MSWQGFSKRKFPRIDCNFNISVLPNDKEPISAIVKNIGIGGVCVISQKQLKLFDRLKLEIKLSDKKSDILCSAKVVWVISTVNSLDKPVFDVGFEFIDLKKKDKDQIQYFVDLMAKKDV